MDLVSYLETLPRDALRQLYGSSWTCQAVLKGLPPLAKLYALRMTFLESPITEDLVESWPKPEALSKHKVAVKKLKELQIFQPGKSRSGRPGWQLQSDFRVHLKDSIIHGRENVQEDGLGGDDVIQDAPERAELDKHSQEAWESLSLYLTGMHYTQPKAAPLIGKLGTLNLDRLLIDAKLMTMDDGAREITEAGFQFLLLDAFQQLWVIIKQYIKTSADSGTGSRLSAVVGFLLQLGGQGLGKPLPIRVLNDLQVSIAADLARLGLILPFRSDNEVYLSPTRLCLALTGAQSAQTHKDISDGFIIVESNYKVVAYTSSALKLAILSQFVRCDVKLPNCMIGSLTRKSVTAALKSGIGHEQIVNYLSQHAAPQVANDVPIVPAVVADQIRLWQAETQRVRHYKAHMYDNFESEELYFMTADYSKELGTWLWQDDKAQRLVALTEGHPALRDFIKANKP